MNADERKVDAINIDMTHIDAIRYYIGSEILGDNSISIGIDDDLLLTETLDSLSIMRLVAHLEETHGMGIPPEDVTIENFNTLRQIGAYLATRSRAAS